jgi:hypothetical protein
MGKRINGGGDRSGPGGGGDELGAALLGVHRAYWTPAPEEKQRLLGARIEGMSWRDILRLHHLASLDLLHAAGLTRLGDERFEAMAKATAGPDAELCAALAGRLHGPTSPYRPRLAFVFQRGCPPEEPSQRGELANASLTHLGALEVIRLERDMRPTAVDFVPFDALHSVHVGPPSLFPPARLEYEQQGRNEVVALPLLYGPSWFTPQPRDRDGSTTAFVCHLEGASGGIGLGHQDFTNGSSVFGLGSIEQIAFPLDVEAPDFEERCRRRGLDPAQVRTGAAGRS